MSLISIVNLGDQYRQLTESGNAVSVRWQESESVAFVARGREYRSEFHTNPSDEVIYMIKGEMRLHYRTPSSREEVAVIPEGSVIAFQLAYRTLRVVRPTPSLSCWSARGMKAKSIASIGSARNVMPCSMRKRSSCRTIETTLFLRPISASLKTRNLGPARSVVRLWRRDSVRAWQTV